jgi:hypothetical protein
MMEHAIHQAGIRLAAFNARAKYVLGEALQAVLFLGGLGAMAFGAWMVYRPLGPIVGGFFAVKIAFLLATEK